MNKLKDKKLHREAIVKGEEQYTLDDYARDFREITDIMTERLTEMGKELGAKDKPVKEEFLRVCIC